jgi:hypothetical protein
MALTILSRTRLHYLLNAQISVWRLHTLLIVFLLIPPHPCPPHSSSSLSSSFLLILFLLIPPHCVPPHFSSSLSSSFLIIPPHSSRLIPPRCPPHFLIVVLFIPHPYRCKETACGRYKMIIGVHRIVKSGVWR